MIQLNQMAIVATGRSAAEAFELVEEIVLGYTHGYLTPSTLPAHCARFGLSIGALAEILEEAKYYTATYLWKEMSS